MQGIMQNLDERIYFFFCQTVTGRDKCCPLIQFWFQQLWPKLASSILKFCGKKRSLQWCPDQSDQSNGVWNMLKNIQKFKWQTWSKISFDYWYIWLPCGKDLCVSMMLSWTLLVNLVHIKNVKNIQKVCFWQKALGISGLRVKHWPNSLAVRMIFLA